MLLARRRIADHKPDWALTTPGLSALRGQRSDEDARIEYADRDDDDATDFEPGGVEFASSGEFDEIDALLELV